MCNKSCQRCYFPVRLPRSTKTYRDLRDDWSSRQAQRAAAPARQGAGSAVILALVAEVVHLVEDDQGWLLAEERGFGVVAELVFHAVIIGRLPVGLETLGSIKSVSRKPLQNGDEADLDIGQDDLPFVDLLAGDVVHVLPPVCSFLRVPDAAVLEKVDAARLHPPVKVPLPLPEKSRWEDNDDGTLGEGDAVRYALKCTTSALSNRRTR